MPNTGILGGTFDTLHDGHHALLNTAFREGDHLRIGLTSDSFANERRTRDVNPFDKRRDKLVEACKTYENIHDCTFQILEITGAYNEATESDADFIAISPEPKIQDRVNEINRTREESDKERLRIIETKRVNDYSGNRISSTKVKKGEINRHGERVTDNQ